ncbi:MAG TPA: ABC transporter permease [Dongiaceae bacterium]|nr:ABC transporter permease [Dongiaceae bacterium]
MSRRFRPAGIAAMAVIAAALVLPIAVYDEDYVFWYQFPTAGVLLLIGLVGLIVGEFALKGRSGGRLWAVIGPIALAIAAAGPILLPASELDIGWEAPGFWLALLGVALFGWTVMAHLSSMPHSRSRDIAVPVLFGMLLIYLWQAIVVGFQVPPVLLPAPTEIAAALVHGAPTLAGDFQQTFLKAVLAGFILGNLIAFATALLADRIPFIQRGLLPLGNFASAVPIVGIAPIMVMWFGFGWESKTAVIVFMIFFPMLVNALAGLNAADRMSLDLMRSYGASYGQTLVKLRLPMALPFLFNALKINSTLALIGAIVAEFFGSPTAGMGFRISVEAARMGLDMVWATIAVAAVAGSAFYGILALLERAFTFWHPSYRAQN